MRSLFYFILVLLLPEMVLTQGITLSGSTIFQIKNNTTFKIGNMVNRGSIVTNGLVNLTGNLTENGSMSGPGSYQFQGTGAETISGSGPLLFGSLDLANSAGLSLYTNVVVSDSLNLVNGIIATGSYMIDMHDTTAGALTGASATAYINGTLRRAVKDSGLYQFPVGSSSNYELAGVHFNANPGKANHGIDSLIAFFTPNDTGCTGVSASAPLYVNGTMVTDLLNGGYWTIHADTSIYSEVNYDVTLYETGATNVPGIPSACAVLKRPSCDSAWVSIGISSNSTQYFSNGAVVAKRSMLTSFSDFGIGFNADGVSLPLEMLYIEAEAINNSYVQVMWATTIEINNYGFVVERSPDAQTWDSIGWTNGNGNSSKQINYSFNDMDAALNVPYYYRLKQVDFNGNYTYTDVATAILISKTYLTISDFIPNPAVSSAYIRITSSTPENVTVDLYDMMGQKLNSKKYAVTPGSGNEIQFDIRNLASGTYSAVILTDGGLYTKRLVVSK